MYHDHWSTADGWDEVPKVQSFGWRQAHEKVVCTVQHKKQPWGGGVWMATDWYGNDCVLRVAWARIMMQTADVDGQVRPAGRAG